MAVCFQILTASLDPRIIPHYQPNQTSLISRTIARSLHYISFPNNQAPIAQCFYLESSDLHGSCLMQTLMLLSDTLTVTEVVVVEVMIVEDVEVEGETTAAQVHIVVMVEIMVALVVISPTNNNLTSPVDHIKVMGAMVRVVDHTPHMVGKVMAHLEVVHQVEAGFQTPNIAHIALEEAMAHRVVLIAGTMVVMVDKETVRAEAMMAVEEVTVEVDTVDTADMADKHQTAMEDTVEVFRSIIHEVEEGGADIKSFL